MALGSAGLLGALRAVLLPQRCVGCTVRGALLCRACEEQIPWLPYGLCPSCGSIGGHDTPRPHCQGPTGPLDEVLVACAFEGPVRRAVQALKYRGARDHAPLLAELLVRAQALNLGGIDLLVPVPLASRRRRERGFNQSELIARELGRRFGIPVEADAALRVRDTDPQVGKSAAERRVNVRDAFRCSDRSLIDGRHVAIVDDVTTTGATLRACADALVTAGAASVVGLAVATGL